MLASTLGECVGPAEGGSETDQSGGNITGEAPITNRSSNVVSDIDGGFLYPRSGCSFAMQPCAF